MGAHKLGAIGIWIDRGHRLSNSKSPADSDASRIRATRNRPSRCRVHDIDPDARGVQPSASTIVKHLACLASGEHQDRRDRYPSSTRAASAFREHVPAPPTNPVVIIRIAANAHGAEHPPTRPCEPSGDPLGESGSCCQCCARNRRPPRPGVINGDLQPPPSRRCEIQRVEDTGSAHVRAVLPRLLVQRRSRARHAADDWALTGWEGGSTPVGGTGGVRPGGRGTGAEAVAKPTTPPAGHDADSAAKPDGLDERWPGGRRGTSGDCRLGDVRTPWKRANSPTANAAGAGLFRGDRRGTEHPSPERECFTSRRLA